ncbi:MAG: DUF3037 domain-containing protein, partial [Leptospirales bacterium]|nr:DUF3037 domain-containing protein [Leptospirales bacterium]
YQYATWRIVPAIERGEFINAGVVVFSRRHKFLKASTYVDEKRLLALDPTIDVASVRLHLLSREAIANGDPAGGPVASQPQSERFGWLVAPSSTVIQSSAVHTGICEDPQSLLDHLFKKLVPVRA